MKGYLNSLTYDDIQLRPQFSDVESRSNVDLRTQLTKRYGLLTPLVASPMDTVCDAEMAQKLMKYGGVGCIHRFMSVGDQCEQVGMVRAYKSSNDIDEEWGVMYDDWHTEVQQIPIMAAIGVGHDELSRAQSLIDAGANILLIDVAHGHHKNVKDMISSLKNLIDSKNKDVDIIAGNVATYEGALDLCKWGVDGVRVGVGGGSVCLTRLETGHGVPNITSIRHAVEACSQFDVSVMADGGIRRAGDIAKALAVGADTVMLGSLLAGTTESPGEVLEKGNQLYKKYRGSASLETKTVHGQKQKHVEGTSTTIPYKGGVKYVIQRLEDGVRSAFSYTGAKDMMEYQTKAEWVQVTNAGITEASPHLL